jgi:hypothetical protein
MGIRFLGVTQIARKEKKMIFPLLQGAKESNINPSGINHSECRDNHQKKCRDNQSQENAEINRSEMNQQKRRGLLFQNVGNYH